MNISIKREIQFEASHRLFHYEGKCKNIHGHNYKVWVYFRNRNNQLDDLGMIIDFNDIKHGIEKWIDDHWDHALILNKNDEENLIRFSDNVNKIYIMNSNPTAENMAICLFQTSYTIYRESNVEVFKVEVYENDKSVAIVEFS